MILARDLHTLRTYIGKRLNCTHAIKIINTYIHTYIHTHTHTQHSTNKHGNLITTSDTAIAPLLPQFTRRFSRLNSIFSKSHGLPSAVYLDDQLSSVSVSGCVFDQIDGRVLLLGGGRYNVFANNLIIQSAPTQSISMDDRGGGGSKCVRPGAMPYVFLARVPYASSASWSKYAGLPTILSDEPCTPKHNIISNNVLCGGAKRFALDPRTVEGWGSQMENNTAVAVCPSSWRVGRS